ncbi:MAG: hypothetical protein LBT43_12160 [Prevotella sp.]|jgi:hypothetical protein|nr:hypothetical protein [Prevotella sp.]
MIQIFKNLILSILLLFLFTCFSDLQAQVTIGSGIAPQRGALLDLKENKDADHNSTKGVLYPRVKLSKKDELYPMYGDANNPDTEYTANKATLKKAHTGLVVYNLTSNDSQTATMDIFVPGMYIWDGYSWKKMDTRLVVIPLIDELKCGSATLSPSQYQAGIPYSGILTIPYINGNGGEYNSVTIFSTNGLTGELQSGSLAIGNGSLQYNIKGTPIKSSPAITEFVINDFLGQNCSVTVGGIKRISTMEYVKYTVALPPPSSVQTINTFTIPVSMGNLNLIYKGSYKDLVREEESILFSTHVDTHLSYYYDKAGSRGHYSLWGKKSLKADTWLALDKGDNVYQSSNSSYTINSVNRDFAVLLISLHNTQETYRVTFNINGDIAATNGIPAIPATLTIFIEKLE